MAQEKVGNIQNTLSTIHEAATIERIEILYYPIGILRRTRITPEILEVNYFYKLIIQCKGSVFYLQSLKQALQDTEVEKSDNESDLRWGILLFGPENRRIASIYVNRLENQGYINSIPVNFTAKESTKGLAQWLKGNFSSVFSK
jgi:hypothetical protein